MQCYTPLLRHDVQFHECNAKMPVSITGPDAAPHICHNFITLVPEQRIFIAPSSTSFEAPAGLLDQISLFHSFLLAGFVFVAVAIVVCGSRQISPNHALLVQWFDL